MAVAAEVAEEEAATVVVTTEEEDCGGFSRYLGNKVDSKSSSLSCLGSRLTCNHTTNINRCHCIQLAPGQ